MDKSKLVITIERQYEKSWRRSWVFLFMMMKS